MLIPSETNGKESAFVLLFSIFLNLILLPTSIILISLLLKILLCYLPIEDGNMFVIIGKELFELLDELLYSDY